MPDYTSKQSRVILLLDLDCFYAQAACIRLGYDSLDTPLALFQWNSVLAVTYPARKKFSVKRGDSWESVARKSETQCLGVHVPILEHNNSGATALSSSSSLREEYEQLYMLSDAEKKEARRTELGVRKFSTEGKASIECFRIASATIFETVQSFLEDNYQGYVLERASIDEFFIDVTNAVDSRKLNLSENEKETIATALETTNVIALPDARKDYDTEDPETSRLQLGCWIAYGIRKAVIDHLGFTMSAGIAHNKTIAKLAASYGKPNGQAVCYPDAVAAMLDETPISKCRFLGGKLGDAVTKLLPDGAETTVGGIAKNLSMVDLQKNMKDPATARWVFDIAHGIDGDSVISKEETSLLSKSITAFKSMNFAPPGSKVIGHSLADAGKWIQLLANEVVNRVERDAARNRRYPKMCTIQYATERTSSNKSMRIPFPSSQWPTERKVSHIIQTVTNAIEGRLKKENLRLHRVGLCATDFEQRDDSTKSITTFFQASAKTENRKSPPAKQTIPPPMSLKKPAKPDTCASDLAMAKKLQESFDREQRMIAILDSKKKRKQAPRIDSYFRKK